MLYRLDKISSNNDVSDINEDNSPNKKDPHNTGSVIVMK